MTGDERHARSIRFPGIGEKGQRRISGFSAAVVGIGAVGAAGAESAARAGIGRLTLVDRDVVEESNLSRQFLFDAADARAVRPKAEAAAERLRAIAPDVTVAGIVADLVPENAREILGGHDLVLDASDNFETRLLVSDAARSLAIPSLYAAAVGSQGLLLASIPGVTPCLRCHLEAPPPPGEAPTCETAGVVPSLPLLVAAAAATEMLRLAVRRGASRGILRFEVWDGEVSVRRSHVAAAPSASCPVCAEKRFPALEGEGRAEVVKLCGRRSVQVAPGGRERPDFDALERRLAPLGPIRRSPQLLSAEVEGVHLTLFSDGRCVVRGTDDPVRAKTLYARYVGR